MECVDESRRIECIEESRDPGAELNAKFSSEPECRRKRPA
jgi:hypothetical protein